MGSDDGFDASSWERIARAEPRDDGDDDERETLPEPAVADRLWLIQCKREKAIGPTKLAERRDDADRSE